MPRQQQPIRIHTSWKTYPPTGRYVLTLDTCHRLVRNRWQRRWARSRVRQLLAYLTDPADLDEALACYYHPISHKRLSEPVVVEHSADAHNLTSSSGNDTLDVSTDGG